MTEYGRALKALHTATVEVAQLNQDISSLQEENERLRDRANRGKEPYSVKTIIMLRGELTRIATAFDWFRYGRSARCADVMTDIAASALRGETVPLFWKESWAKEKRESA